MEVCSVGPAEAAKFFLGRPKCCYSARCACFVFVSTFTFLSCQMWRVLTRHCAASIVGTAAIKTSEGGRSYFHSGVSTVAVRRLARMLPRQGAARAPSAARGRGTSALLCFFSSLQFRTTKVLKRVHDLIFWRVWRLEFFLSFRIITFIWHSKRICRKLLTLSVETVYMMQLEW